MSGGSSIVAIPHELMEEMEFMIGTDVSLRVEKGRLIIEKKKPSDAR
jgi:antitoxin component of MazEF toxin-antitoxin module